MFTDWERTCLLRLATECKARGLTFNDTCKDMENSLHGFSSTYHIQRAARRIFAPHSFADVL